MTSHIDVLILTNVVACAPCRNLILLKEHDWLCLALPRYFGNDCAAGRGESGEPSVTLAVCEPGRPKAVSSDSSSLFSLLLADSKKLFL